MMLRPRARARGMLLGLAAGLGAACAGCGGGSSDRDGGAGAGEEQRPPGPPEPFSVLTFNVLCSFCGLGEYDSWDARLAYFDDLFRRHDPDLLGLQELAFASEVDQILALRPGYEAVFYKAADISFTYPDATILFRSERFELREHGFYWLSPTPDVPSSTGFADGQQLPRLVAWAELVDKKSRRGLYFASTHFDNNSPSQEESAPLVLERTAPAAANLPVVVVGDFNSQPADPAYHTLLDGKDEGGFRFENAQDIADQWRVDTNQDPAPEYDLDERIDHVFVAGDGVTWRSPEWVVDLHVYGPDHRYPSDHRAMAAMLDFAVDEGERAP